MPSKAIEVKASETTEVKAIVDKYLVKVGLLCHEAKQWAMGAEVLADELGQEVDTLVAIGALVKADAPAS